MNKAVKELGAKVLRRNLEKESDSICAVIFHQEKAPVELKKFSKKHSDEK